MPELPEVEKTIQDLRKKILGYRIENIWFDWQKIVKKPKNFKQFEKEIQGKKILNIWRRGKNILIDLSGGKTLLIHQKLTGHLLVGNWRLEAGKWKPLKSDYFQEKISPYIHLAFWLNRKLMLVVSDLRKFAKVELWDKEELLESKEFQSLGIEPLSKSFTFKKFKEIIGKTANKIKGAKTALSTFVRNNKGKNEINAARSLRLTIKQVLMNQTIIAGIGNIYSDEILFEARINPLRKVIELKIDELKKIYKAIKKILKNAIKFGEPNISEFGNINPNQNFFSRIKKVYQREGEKCVRCKTIIKRIKLSGRSSYFCPKCQT